MTDTSILKIVTLTDITVCTDVGPDLGSGGQDKGVCHLLKQSKERKKGEKFIHCPYSYNTNCSTKPFGHGTGNL